MPEGYAVIAQRQLADVLADGRVGDVMEVTFQTSSGVTNSIRVPIDSYHPEVVDELIRRRVSLIAAVHRLEGSAPVAGES